MNLVQVKEGHVKVGEGKLGQVKSVQVYLEHVKSGQVKYRQVKLVKSVQVKMDKMYLGPKCGPTQSYLLSLFSSLLRIEKYSNILIIKGHFIDIANKILIFFYICSYLV